MPNHEQLIKIAKYLNVSTDYLLGLSETPTADKDVQFICDYTGLDNGSVNTLHRECDNVFLNLMLNFLINSPKLVRYIGNYFLTGLYDEYFKSDFGFLPLKSDSLLNSRYAADVLFSKIIKSLPRIMDEFLDNLNDNHLLKYQLFEMMAKNSVDYEQCRNDIAEYDASFTIIEEVEKSEETNAEFVDFLENVPEDWLVCEAQKHEDEENAKMIEFIKNFLQNQAKKK